ncbi:hypothetical protein [Agromyces badenianii]|uniref:hypothetical protein n=1 Tax=Agromyces badenianii TaxID=2080742 RepID=UPI000D58EEC4|nr:hypothetical protein [Agromyces badenianii]PWC04295.1 hypothetical protein DCE94_09085 [Agromyces badenianii]
MTSDGAASQSQAMRDVQPPPRKRRALMRWSSAVALLSLLFLLVGSFLVHQQPIEPAEATGVWVGEDSQGRVSLSDDGVAELQDIHTRTLKSGYIVERHVSSARGTWRIEGNRIIIHFTEKGAATDLGGVLRMISERPLFGDLALITSTNPDSSVGEERFLRRT